MSAAIVDRDALLAWAGGVRAQGETIAFANGCFDVLHVGHVRMLAEAATHGDLLVVALNSDASVTANKGRGRPYTPLAERMEIVAALAGVHHVTSFPEPTAHALLSALRPDVYVKGTDRAPDSIPEHALLQQLGARLVIAGDSKTHSSTALIDVLRRGAH